MSSRRRSSKDDVDLLEGFSFDAVLDGKIEGPEAFVPNLQVPSALETRVKVEPILSQSEAKVEPRSIQSGNKLEPKLSQS